MGGGGDNVKHGDLSSALYQPDLAIDVHMSPEGEDFACSTCHVSDRHQWSGSRYMMQATDPHGTGKPGEARRAATCESCHGPAPHSADLKGITRDGLGRVARFYVRGIFKGEPHPYRKAYWRKHNPLQALTYLALKIVLFPAVWITGLLALGWNLWEDMAGAPALGALVSDIHLLAAYAIAAFVIVHVYLLTVGHSFRDHVRPMITGFDKVTLTPEEEAYLQADEPGRIKPRD